MDPTPLDTVVVLNDFTYIQGGASKVAIDEAVALAASGIRVIFIGAVGPIGPDLASSSVETICLDQPELLDVARRPGVALQSMWNRTAYRRMHTVLSRLSPAHSIVHLHGYTKALSTSPVAAAREAGFETVCTLHDFFAACPNGALFDYVAMTPCERQAMSRDCITASCDKRHRAHKLFRVARSAVQQHVAGFPRDVGAYIALSNRSVALLRPYLPASSRFFPLRNVIDVARRPRVPVAANAAITCVGRLDEEKGVRLLCDAAATLGLDLVFVGDGPLRQECEARPGVTVTGWVSPARVQALLDQARCLVFPSLWYETYGLVVDEAAARGVPCIASDISAAAERVRHGVTGWHFRSGNSISLLDALAGIRDNSAIEQAGSAAYAEFWEAPETAERHTASLMRIYHDILGPGGSVEHPRHSGRASAPVTIGATAPC